MLTTALVAVAGPARPAAAAGSCGTTNAALGAAATASSTGGSMTAGKAIDNKTSTRWASLASDPQWLQLDFGSRPNVCQVSLNWAAYASAFSVQISDDATRWTTLTTTGASSNTVQTLSVFGTGRYLRMYGTARGVSSTGYSLKEFQVFTQPSQPPAFTSASTATFVVGQASSFTVTTSGIPTVTLIAESGSLPAGLSFTDNGNGTATIAGAPTGSGGSYPVTLTATNGVLPNATQNLAIQLNQAPAVTLNPSDQTVAPGTSVSFSAAASGVPTPTVQWQRSTDGGASFTNIAGATSTTYTFTAVAGDDGNEYQGVFSNGVGSPAITAPAVLSVGAAPVITSANHTSFVVGAAGSFGITTTGVPSATLTRAGAQFPAWLTLTDNGDGTGSLTGTPPAGSAG
ncbi:MAG TPA: discoidin domain-containing protein, partial [Jatrophihabitans sp.]|nr:discoidin domain-containing protein [Jatrophihabitans sp.]